MKGRHGGPGPVEISPATKLSRKEKELLRLAVPSQVLCRYCVVAHTEFAKLNGDTDAEITGAIAMASLTRNMRTLLNGLNVDEPQFRRDLDHLVKVARASAKPTSMLSGEGNGTHTDMH
jgi:AhpD family alkylhydroperoxidase